MGDATAPCRRLQFRLNQMNKHRCPRGSKAIPGALSGATRMFLKEQMEFGQTIAVECLSSALCANHEKVERDRAAGLRVYDDREVVA
jgi:hypothetical protein